MRKYLNLDTLMVAVAVFCACLAFAPGRTLAGVIQAIIPQAVPVANKLGNSTVFQLAATTTAAGTGTLLCEDASGNSTTANCFVPPGQLTYYLSNTASDISTYLQATQAPYSPKTQLDFTGLANGTDTLKNWATVPGQPGVAFIPAGIYNFHIHASKNAGANVSVQTQFWEVNAAGADIALIGTSDATGNLTTSEVQYDLSFANGNTYTLASTTSRIVARVQAVVSSGPGVAHIFVGGTADSHISIPNAGGGGSGGGAGTPGSTLFSSTTSAGPSDTAAETSLIGTVVGSTTIPANTFTNGALLHASTQGFFSLPAVADGLTLKVKCGTTVLGSAAFTPAAGVVTNGTFRFWLDIASRGSGAGGTFITNGGVDLYTGGPGTFESAKVLNTTTVGFDFTTACVMDVTAQWGGAQVGESITGTNAAAWIPGAPVTSVGGLTGAVPGEGNSTKVQLFAGADPATNDCAKFDVNHNLITAGAACGSGGGVTSVGGLTGAVPGGMVLQEQHTAAGSAELDFTTCISSSYDNYQVQVVNIIPASDNQDLRFQFSQDGGATYDATSGHYLWGGVNTNEAGTSAVTHSTTSAGFILFGGVSNSTLFGLSGSVQFSSPASTAVYKPVTVTTIGRNTTPNYYFVTIGGPYAQTAAVTGFRVIFASGNIASGTVRCYGIAKQ